MAAEDVTLEPGSYKIVAPAPAGGRVMLLREACLIGGEWIAGDRWITVRDPASGGAIARVPDFGAVETERAIFAAQAAFPAWSRQSGKARALVLRRFYDLMIEHQEELAALLTSEQGKPLAEARGEISYAASFLEWFGEEAKRASGDIIPGHQADKRIFVMKQPVGVVAAITPWNFPAAMVTRKLAPALAAGCTAILKPAEQTPLTALAIAALGERAGVPPGVLNVVTGSDAAAIGGALTASPTVRKLSFTGSTTVGARLYAQCAPTIKKLSLELGGNAPFIVFDDADLDAAVEGAIQSKYRNAGQTCVCANRLYVQAGIHDAFVERLAQAVDTLTIGPGLQDGVTIGPLIEERALEKVEAHIADAVAQGARVVTGGRRHERGGSFFVPTVLAGVRTGMRVTREETFGPLAPVIRFHREDEVVAMANDSDFGLAAYLFTRDSARLWRVAEALECGIVGANTGLISTEVAPFGGVKMSGLGREGSTHGLDDYLELKYLCMTVDQQEGGSRQSAWETT